MKSNIHDLIDKWHEGEGAGKELHEYLGLTWAQYATWAETSWLAPDSHLHDPNWEVRRDLGA